VLFISFWRGTSDLAGHVKTVSETIVESLAKQSQTHSPSEDDSTVQRVRKLYPGMGHIDTLRIDPGCFCAGKPLAGLNVSSLTGAAILVLMREEGNSFLPTGKDILKPGDLIVLAGAPESVNAAKNLLVLGLNTQKDTNARRP